MRLVFSVLLLVLLTACGQDVKNAVEQRIAE
jgi:hypothetical protein